MKVASHHQARNAQPSSRRVAVPEAPSFSQMIEGGARGADIAASRALGFAETGLLGLHYAHKFDQPQAQGGAAENAALIDADAIPEAFDLSALREVDIAHVQWVPASARGLNRGFDRASLVPHARSTVQAVTDAMPAAVQLGEVDGADACSVARSMARRIAAEQRTTPFRLLVSGGIDAAVIVFEGETLSPADTDELEALALKIAQEFGATVKRFVTRTHFGIRFGSGS